MTVKGREGRAPRCPQGFDLLLPWHVSGKLSPEEAKKLEEHIDGCPICQEELEAIKGERELYRDVTGEVPVPSALGPLLSELEEKRGLWGRIVSSVKSPLQWPRPALVVVALQALLIVALLSVLSINPWGMGEGLYRTLSGPQRVMSEGPRLQILFYEDVPEKLIRRTLLEIGGEIVGGPTPMGLYTVQLPRETSSEGLKRILSTLRGRKGLVRYVEVGG